ncbi:MULTISPECIES: ferredoxin [Pseudomonas]|uniref:ferredoxin n=1 Tax=Pseudomonas TaxID=286 RepID=UPI000CD3BABB|nr:MULTISPECIES: ferredoxin [Pseudomonas]PTC01752.1 ferredoxin [Thalassospira xiamenensis]AVD83777.1 ferredoxin [Pseudomonas sp. SWI6]AVD95053.1 ferredoxin [Pseudomonas sp. SWI36]ELU0814309.1 ferredoxin [Pseudomonas putida]MBH3388637.1 ferredoxin [Pseudomonas putida]
MKVQVDEARCQGHARCVYFAPEVFEIDDEGYAKVKPGFEDVPSELQDSVKKACANCPELAIKIS